MSGKTAKLLRRLAVKLDPERVRPGIELALKRAWVRSPRARRRRMRKLSKPAWSEALQEVGG